MFTKEITGLTLANNVADKMFPNLNAEKFRNDESFTATLRALLHSRVPAEESVSVYRTSSRYRNGDIKDKEPTEAVNLFLQDRLDVTNKDCTGVLVLHSFDNTEEENNTSFELLDKWAAQGTEITGYEFCEDLTAFFGQKKIKLRFYINPTQKNTLIFMERVDIKKWHIIQSVISRYLPWYFKDNPLTVEEASLVKSLIGRYAPDYEKHIAEFTAKFDFRTATIKLMLGDFETKFDKQKLSELETQMRRQQENIDSYRRNYIDSLDVLDRLRIEHLGLYTRIHSQDETKESEFLNYCLRNQSLNIVNVTDDGVLDVVITTHVASYDPDLAQRLIKNGNSAFYKNVLHDRRYNTELTSEQLKALWTEVFIKERFKILTCAKYQLDFKNKRCRAGQSYEFGEEYKNYAPNQHIWYHGCLGNNERHISKSLGECDFIGAVNACIGSASNINMAESSTTTRLLAYVLNEHNDNKYIQLPNGECATALEAVAYLEQEKKKKTEAKKEKSDE